MKLKTVVTEVAEAGVLASAQVTARHGKLFPPEPLITCVKQGNLRSRHEVAKGFLAENEKIL